MGQESRFDIFWAVESTWCFWNSTWKHYGVFCCFWWIRRASLNIWTCQFGVSQNKNLSIPRRAHKSFFYYFQKKFYGWVCISENRWNENRPRSYSHVSVKGKNWTLLLGTTGLVLAHTKPREKQLLSDRGVKLSTWSMPIVYRYGAFIKLIAQT